LGTKRVGQILRDAREEQRLTVRDVSKDTNIAVKFILALENEDYSQFPAETFAMGFLKTYSDYLKLDTAFIMNLYRGEQMEETYAPLEELTKPTKPIVNSVKGDKSRWITVLAIVLFIIAFIILGYFLDDSDNSKPTTKKNTSKVEKNEKGIPSDVSFIQQVIADGKDTPVILSPDKGISFSINSQQCKLFLKEVLESGSGKNTAVLGFSVYPEPYIHYFQVIEGEDTLLSYTNEKLSSLQKEVLLKAQIVTVRSAKIIVSLGKEQLQDNIKAQGSAHIQISMKFSKETFVDFVVDGQPGEKGKVKKGSIKEIKAMDRVEIKILDASAVELTKNGEKVGKLGRPGQSVKKVYYRAPSPFDSTKYIIKESGD
jgi:transcriptional regulator with XRE-family HTH domain